MGSFFKFSRTGSKTGNDLSRKQVRKLAKEDPANILTIQGHNQPVNEVLSLPGRDTLVTACDDGTLRIVSTITGQCHSILRHSDTSTNGLERVVTAVTALDANTLVSIGLSKTARVWRVSDSMPLDVMTFKDPLKAIVSLGNGRVAIASKTGFVYDLQWNGTFLYKTGLHVKTGVQGKLVNSMASNHSFLATASHGSSAELWESVSLNWVTTVQHHEDTVWDISLGSKVMVTCSIDATICVHDANTLRLLRKLKANASVYSVELSGNEDRVVCSTAKGIAVYNLTNGHLIWAWKEPTDTAFARVRMLPEGRIAAGGFNGRCVVITPPPQIARQIPRVVKDVGRMDEALPPVQTALCHVLMGHSSANTMCRTVIVRDACASSVSEWVSAHLLLMLAVVDREIPNTHSFSGRDNWWLDQLYSSAKRLPITSPQDVSIVKGCFDDARCARLIQDPGAVWEESAISQRPWKDMKQFFHEGSLMVQRIVEARSRLYRVDGTAEEKPKEPNSSELVGVAMQIMAVTRQPPVDFSCSTISGASERSNKFDVEYIFGLSCGAGQSSEGGNKSYFDRILGRAQQSISEDQLEYYGADMRNHLEQFTLACGYEMEELRDLLKSRENGGDRRRSSNIHGTSLSPAEKVRLQISGDGIGSLPAATEVARLQEELFSFSSPDDIGERSEERSDGRELSDGLYDKSLVCRDRVKKSSPRDLANRWSMYILNTREGGNERLAYADCICKVLCENHITGSLLCSELVNADGVMELIIRELGSIGNINFTLGRAGRARQFLSDLLASPIEND